MCNDRRPLMAPTGFAPGRRALLTLAAGAVLAGCAQRGETDADEPDLLVRLGDWHEVPLPGKRRTSYSWARKDGREAIEAVAERSASMLRRRLAQAKAGARHLNFAWLVPQLIVGSNVARSDSEDAPARVLLAFGGDHARLSARDRMMFDLADALTGERPPFATLMYVWEREAPLESVIVNPRTERIRKIVADSGSEQLGRWREHRRDIVADFRRAFGEDPGPLQSVAVMTDADNTASSARAWYASVVLS